MKKTAAQEAERDEHMHNAITAAVEICQIAELRGLTGYDVTASLASILAGRNPTLAGKVLNALGNAIRRYPVTKVIEGEAVTIH